MILIVALLIIMTVIIILSCGIGRSLRRNGGIWVGMGHTGPGPRWKNCRDCDGCGVTMIDGSIIPPKYRTWGPNFTNGRIANTIECDGCQGMGHFWVDGEKKRNNVVGEK